MNTPAYVASKIAQRFSYNVGRVQKEAGLRKSHSVTQYIFQYLTPAFFSASTRT